MKPKKICFLDCDGTIREPASGAKFISRPDDQRIIEGAREAIEYYHSKNYALIGITNQGGVAAGHKSLEEAIEEQNITLQLIPELKAIFFCPDFEGNTCWMVNRASEEVEFKRIQFPNPHAPGELLYQSFRKPGSGMIMLAIDQLFYPDECWMIGDREEDALAASGAGINFMWADVWRDRFKKGFNELDLSNRHIDKDILLKFLAI